MKINRKKLKVGLIGLGEQMTDNLLPSLLISNKVTIESICDINDSILSSYAFNLNLAEDKIFNSYEEMINKVDLDLVIISSYPNVHFEAAKKCIQNKIHVFVEKPPTRTKKQLQTLISLSKDFKVKTGVGMNFSFTDVNQSLQEVINHPEFGDIDYLSIEHISSKPTTPFWNFDSIIESFLLAQLIHPLNYIISIAGRYRKINVYRSKGYVPLFTNIVIEFESGTIGTIKSGSFSPRFRHEIEVISNRGNMVKIKDLANLEIHQKTNPAPFNIPIKYCSTLKTRSPLKSGYSSAGYSGELDSFIESIHTDTKFLHSFESMLPTYEALEDIFEKMIKKETEFSVLNRYTGSIQVK